MPTTDRPGTCGMAPVPQPRIRLDAQLGWFVLLWLLGVLAAGCAAGVVKLLMRGAVAL